MANPKDNEEKLARILNAWKTLAPGKSFGGMAVSQFEEATYPSTEFRGLILTLQDQLTEALNKRDAADKVTLAKIQHAVNGVRADPTEGPDSALYEAFGYTPASERKTGLTRKKKDSGGKQE